MCDLIEKEPFFHVLPRGWASSFGMLGVTSQTLRSPCSYAPAQRTSPERLVQQALQQGAEVGASTYHDPLITA